MEAEGEKDGTGRGVHGGSSCGAPLGIRLVTQYSRPREEWDKVRLGAGKEGERCSVATHHPQPY